MAVDDPVLDRFARPVAAVMTRNNPESPRSSKSKGPARSPSAAPTPAARVSSAAPLRVLGIDPGTATTGFALVVEGRVGGGADEPTLVDCGVIRTKAGVPMPQRLVQIHEALCQLIEELRPDAVAVEELFFSANVTTAISVGQARGVILLAAASAGLPVAEYKPNVVKQAVSGYGGADKRQMQEMVRMLLRLAEAPRPDDAADAVAIALCPLQMGWMASL